jgi:hypothetical protein
MRWAGYVACPAHLMGVMTNAHKILVGKPERKSPLGRARCRWILGIQSGKMRNGCNRLRINIPEIGNLVREFH